MGFETIVQIYHLNRLDFVHLFSGIGIAYDCINAASNIRLYVLGPGKGDILVKVLTSRYEPAAYPSQGVGTATHKALWIADSEASHNFKI